MDPTLTLTSSQLSYDNTRYKTFLLETEHGSFVIVEATTQAAHFSVTMAPVEVRAHHPGPTQDPYTGEKKKAKKP